jgi:hypothetical protein
MHPDIAAALGSAHERELRDKVGRVQPPPATTTNGGAPGGEVVIRAATASDGPALVELAELDDAQAPLVPALVAEVCGKLAAVLPLDGGRAYSDPFRRTEELVALLELRASQITSSGWTPHTRFRWPAPAVLRRLTS